MTTIAELQNDLCGLSADAEKAKRAGRQIQDVAADRRVDVQDCLDKSRLEVMTNPLAAAEYLAHVVERGVLDNVATRS